MGGFVKLHRKIREHEFYLEKRKFSKLEAWIDLLMMANYKDTRVVLGNQFFDLKKGQFITSELKLMERWDWGKAKLRAFLTLLENDGMIVKISDRKKTTITICNYCIYHDSGNENRPPADHQQTTDGLLSDTEKNLKELQELKRKNIYTIFQHWNSLKIIVHRELNKKAESHISARLEKYSLEEMLEAVSNYNTILKDDKYFWNYKWSLEDFMLPDNMAKFASENEPLTNFLTKTKGGKANGKNHDAAIREANLPF